MFCNFTIVVPLFFLLTVSILACVSHAIVCLMWQHGRILNLFSLCELWMFFFSKKDLNILQTVQHKLAELKTEICVGRTFVDNCLQLLAEKRLDPSTASMAKFW